MKIAISGKGGVGKTTISALVAASLRERGCDVIAIDADPDSNLLACLGHPDPASVPPLVELKALIEERMGVKPGTPGALFRLNPEVGDLPDKYAVEAGGVRVLVAGAVKKGGTGCYCPENALVQNLVSHVLLDENVALVLDMEAGVEHLTRGTVRSVDCLLVVTDAGRRSIETGMRIGAAASELGIRRVCAVGNKVRGDDDKAFLEANLPDMVFAGFVPFAEEIAGAERNGRSVVGVSEAASDSVREIVTVLQANN